MYIGYKLVLVQTKFKRDDKSLLFKKQKQVTLKYTRLGKLIKKSFKIILTYK